MCRQVSCGNCGKPTWAGCGAHVEQVLGHIPEEQRCQCRAQAQSKSPGPTESLGDALWKRITGR